MWPFMALPTCTNLIEFRRELGKRGLTINYDVEDFQADVETLRSLGRL